MKSNGLSLWLSRRLAFLKEIKQLPDFVVGPAEDPYLLRWFLLPRNPVFNIYLHHMRHDDEDRALHDHPWASVSLCLDGIIVEHTKSGTQIIVEGDVVWRSSRFAHRLEVFQPSWTIFVTGPRVREWGFHCPQGWRHWKDFTSPGDKGQIGRGCGE